MNKRQLKKLEDKKIIEGLNARVKVLENRLNVSSEAYRELQSKTNANKDSIANIIEAQSYMQIENDKKYSELKEMHKSLADLIEKTVDSDYEFRKFFINDLICLEYKVFLLNIFVVVLFVLLVITWLV